MLKLIMCVKRRENLTREEFDHYWINKHAPLVRDHQKVLGIRRYIQNVPLSDLAAQTAIQTKRGTEPVDFDGCAELWWDSLEAHKTARETDEGKRALQILIEDELRFINPAKSQLWYSTERPIIFT